MAKKVRRKLEEEEAAAFEFPVFDERAFVTKEFEMGTALAIASLLTGLVGVMSWALTYIGIPYFVPLGIGIVVVVASPFIIRRLRIRSDTYTKGDWAALIAMQFFGWLALWFVLVNLA